MSGKVKLLSVCFFFLQTLFVNALCINDVLSRILYVVCLISSLVIFCCNSVNIQYFKGSKLRKQDFTQRQKLETKKFPFLNSFQILSRGKLKTVFVLFSYNLYYEFSNKEWICIVILRIESPFYTEKPFS